MKNIKNYTTFRIKRITAVFLAVLTLFGIGCAAPEPEKTEAEEDIDIAVPVAPAEPSPIEGGEIRMYIPYNADMTDPLRVNTEEMMNLFSLVYESLINITSDGKVSAELAENWTTEDNGKTWTVKLRNDVLWHNDEGNVTAGDVVNTFARLKEIGPDSYYSYCADKIESIEEIDRHTLKVTTKDGGYASIYGLNFPVLLNGTAAIVAPIGTGPYKYYGYEGGYVFEANDKWWRHRPYIDRFVFLERDSNDTALASFSAGQLDIVPTSSASAGKFRQTWETVVKDIMTQSVEVLLLNNYSGTLGDSRIRKAIAYALDRNKIISNVYMNRAQAADVPVAPDSWIYEPKSKLYDHNKAKALELFAEAGWSDIDDDGMLEKDEGAFNELSIQLLVNESTDPTRKNAANAIAEQLTEFGIQAEVISAPYSIAANKNDYIQMLQNGEYDMALLGLNLGRDGDLREIMGNEGSAYYGNYYDQELYSLAQDIMAASDEAGYRDAASKFQLAFADKLPFITLYFRLNSMVCDVEIKGMTDVREPNIMRNAAKWYLFTNEALVQNTSKQGVK